VVADVAIVPQDLGPLTNSVALGGTTTDPVPGNNRASIVTLVGTPFEVNLIANGDAESGPGSITGTEIEPIPGWQVTSNLTAVRYGIGTPFPSLTNPGPPDRGANFFSGGRSNAVSSAVQVVELDAAASYIDGNRAPYDFSAYLGGSTDQADAATLSATFFSSTNSVLGSTILGPVTPADRTNTTGLHLRTAAGALPTGTRLISFRLDLVRSGTFNDAFADNLSFILHSLEESRLTIQRTSNSVVLGWPAQLTGYRLQSASRLETIWTDVTNAPVVDGEARMVTNKIDTFRRFYRLKQP